jgi:hypothetical protein
LIHTAFLIQHGERQRPFSRSASWNARRLNAGLAAPMTATGETAMMFLNRGALPDLEQIEAIQRLKGKTGQQKVTVEHVHVHDGGQAIVGAMTTTKKERVRK